ncbi:MAG: DNA repair protein RadC [Streptococcaceae bacterium]|nr:DNA repair protein RadC [Streptococcaceae bacterium]
MYQVRENEYSMQPRERLTAVGAEKLSEQELLAILLRTGTKNETVMHLSAKILSRFGSLENFRRSSIEELKQISGIGLVKAIEIRAMIELGKRIQNTERIRLGKVSGSQQLGMILADEMADYDQEHLVAVYLDGQNAIIQKKTIFIGSVNHSPANPREILYYAIKNLAVSVVVAHNHPSGAVLPSTADRMFTNKIQKSCQDIGIDFLDHIIVGRKKYFSFREEKMLKNI